MIGGRYGRWKRNRDLVPKTREPIDVNRPECADHPDVIIPRDDDADEDVQSSPFDRVAEPVVAGASGHDNLGWRRPSVPHGQE